MFLFVFCFVFTNHLIMMTQQSLSEVDNVWLTVKLCRVSNVNTRMRSNYLVKEHGFCPVWEYINLTLKYDDRYSKLGIQHQLKSS